MKHPNVVVAFDFTTLGEIVLERAAALVGRSPSHVLHFLTVIDHRVGVPGIPPDGAIDHLYADKVRDALLGRVRDAFVATGVPDDVHCFAHARIGKPAQEILNAAEELGADLVMVGTHGRTGVERLLLGSTAEHVVREAGCPVIVARPKHYADVELATITEVPGPHPTRSRMTVFTYTNATVVTQPADFTIPH